MYIMVSCMGMFIGDILFASSLAKKLKEKYPDSYVMYNIPLVQPKLLLEQNPYIDKVITPLPDGVYGFPHVDMHITLPYVDQRYPATIQFQAHAGIEDQSTEYEVFTVPEYDAEAKSYLYEIYRQHSSKPLIAFQRNWIEKSFKFTPEEYARGIDVPNMGYGGEKHDIAGIIRKLSDHCYMLPVGLEPGISQHSKEASDAELYARTASLIKHCDFMLGAEGGLINLAAGVGTRCIMTTDFIWQLYGPNGLMRKIDLPAMGPATYFPDRNHVHLDPFADEIDIINSVLNIVKT